jgi:hypothetical protein
MHHAQAEQVRRPATSRAPWIAATVVGLIGAAAWWVPPYPPDPWASIIAWVVLLGAALVSAAVAYIVGARGATVVLASALAVGVTFVAWPLILFVLVVIGQIVELLIAL